MSGNCSLFYSVTCETLKELWLHVIYRCNLQCKHCLFACSPEEDGPGELSFNECRRYVKDALEQGVQAIYLTGGEPTLWSDLREFLSWYYGLDQIAPLTILTNGTLIDPQLAAYLSSFVPQGLVLRVSMECYTPGNHEEFRGAGSFRRALMGIKNLNNCGVRPWVAYVNKSGGGLPPDGADNLERDFTERLGADYGLEIAGLKIISAYSKGRFAGRVKPHVSPEQYVERISTVQCTYGVAVSKGGIFPCPVLVDVPRARLCNSLVDAVGRPFSIDYEFCSSCFATGTTCGQ